MPSGRVHDAITVAGAAVAVPAWWLYTSRAIDPSLAGTLVGSILFSGLMLSPDLDLKSSVYRRWGILRFLWWPYRQLVPHRSWISHSWILGPILRVGYFLIVLWAISHVLVWLLGLFGWGHSHPLRNPIDLLQDLWRNYPHHAMAGLIGLLIGTGLHTGADALVSGYKKVF